MDEKLQILLNQFQDRLISIPEEQIAAMMRQAQEEALAEAKEVIKMKMVRAILERTLTDGHRPTADAHRSLVAVTGQQSRGEDVRIQEEIEDIRRRIAENEQVLSQIKAAPSQPGETTPAVEHLPDSQGYYVYGITENSHLLEGLSEKGIDPAYTVFALPCQTIQAIVSQVSLQEFGQEALKANLNDPLWLETKVRAHQAVLETASVGGALIPMKFCTIYLSEARVQEMLAGYHDHFGETLKRLSGKQERGMKIFCGRDMLTRRVEETSENVKALKAEIAGKSNGVAYFARRKLDAAISEEVERLSDECAQSSHDRLAACAAEARVTPLQSKEVTGRDEEMVLNGAYLVSKEKMTVFQSELESLENEYSPLGFIYELTGPWPPYNFVTIGAGEGIANE